MKTALATLCLVLFATTMVFGQQTNQRAPHKGRIKIWTGVVLVAAGLFVTPVTAMGHTGNSYEPRVAGVGVAAVGGTLIWWGMRDAKKATRPNKTFGVMVGPKSQIRLLCCFTHTHKHSLWRRRASRGWPKPRRREGGCDGAPSAAAALGTRLIVRCP